DDAVLHRTNRGDVAGRAPKHLLRRHADLLDDLLAVRPAFLADRDHRRLVQHDALAAEVVQRVRRTEVDGEVAGEITFEKLEHVGRSPRVCGRNRPPADRGTGPAAMKNDGYDNLLCNASALI